MWAGRSKTFNRRQLTIGLDLGNRFSCYCVLDEVAEVSLEQKLPTTPEAIRRTFEKIPRSRMALETGTHSRWVSRLLTVLGHEVIVAHARNVRLIGESRRKDDRLDARTLASGGCGEEKTGGTAASLVGQRRGLGANTQQTESSARGGIKSS
jgi:transposase